MPEGPEVRREADAIGRVLTGKKITESFFEPAHLKHFAPRLVGQQVVEVTTRGKALLIFFQNGRVLYSHNQLYGRWVVVPKGKAPSTNRILRVALTTNTHSALLYSATDIAFMAEKDIKTHPYLKKLGPDVLSQTLLWRQITERLCDKRFSGRSISGLYLDQSFLAGLGNYLRSEILFAAGIDPTCGPKDLEPVRLNELARRTLLISLRAYKTGGVTNHPDTVRVMRKAGHSKRQYRFAVFGRDKRGCYRCAAKIRRITANGRRLYLCPSCQQ